MIASLRPEPTDAPAADPVPGPIRRRSGGPRTPEGKAKSRENALKHGLRAEVLLPEDLAELVNRHTASFRADLTPETPYQEWLIGEAATAAARLDRCAELAAADLLRVVERAEDCWDDDRRQTIEDLGARLGDEPSRIAHALRATKPGADWLIERWDGLAHVARTLGTWDANQRTLAFDLLGSPKELRNASAKLPADADAATLAALADREAAALREKLAAYLDHLDEQARERTIAGAPLHEDATSTRLRRYEAESRRALRWALAEFRRVRPAPSKPAAAPKPTAPARAPSPTQPEPPRVAEARERLNAVRDAMQANAPAPAPDPTPAPAARPLSRRARRELERRARAR